MSEGKPVQKTPAWLLVADRYIAEIAEAERLEALAAARHMGRVGRARCAVLGPSRSNYARNGGLNLIAQARGRSRARDYAASSVLH